MRGRTLIVGPNFSGRSRALMNLLRATSDVPASFFVGPYAEAALSGLSSVVADEIRIYQSSDVSSSKADFSPLDFTSLSDRKPQTLSGGEQVLLALHCFSRSAYQSIAIDVALEQLDGANRALALDYLGGSSRQEFDVVLTDNRLDGPLPHWSCTEQTNESATFACDLPALANHLLPQHAGPLAIHDLHFGYRNGRTILRGADLTLEPGAAHRLLGPNGAGKTTLLKILVGVLTPSSGRISLDGVCYEPARTGNRAIALATQNPDHQWCGATLREDVTRRRSTLTRRIDMPPPADERIARLGRDLGFPSLDQPLYELPLAARKRLSWLWPFSGALPWIMLDEPTIGQDRDTRRELALVVRRLCALGYGIIFVTHDDDFAAQVPHRRIAIENMTISTS